MEPPASRWSFVIRAGMVIGFAWIARAYLAPVALGGLLAIVLHPIHRRLAGRIGDGKAALALTIAVLAVAVLPLALLVIHASTSLAAFIDHEWPATARQIRDYLTADTGPLARIGLDGAAVSDATDSLVQNAAGVLARVAGWLVAGLPNQVIALFLLCAGLFYLLVDGPRAVAWLERASPFTRAQTADLVATMRHTVRGVVVGVAGTALVQGGLTVVALAVFAVPAPFALGVLAGMLSIVPLLGTTPVTIGAVIFLATQGRIEAAIGMTVAAVIIGVSDNLVRPYLMHVATPHQHPLVILLGVFGGITTLGAAGVFIGPVVAALAAWAVLTASERKARPA